MPGGDTAACHQKTCSLVPPCMEPVDINQSLLSRFLEDGRRSRQVSRVRGHFPPLEGPWRQLRNRDDQRRRSPTLSRWRSPRNFLMGRRSIGVGCGVGNAAGAFGPKWQGSRQIMGQQIFSNWSRLHNCQKAAFPLHQPLHSLSDF